MDTLSVRKKSKNHTLSADHLHILDLIYGNEVVIEILNFDFHDCCEGLIITGIFKWYNILSILFTFQSFIFRRILTRKGSDEC